MTTMTTTSTTLALFTAAATITGIGFAYWSFEWNTTNIGTILFQSLRSRGKRREKKNPNKQRKAQEESNKAEEMKRAFLAWLDREENENRISRFVKNRISRKEKDLTDPSWMSETIRSFLSPSPAKVVTRKLSISSVSSTLGESSIGEMTASSTDTEGTQSVESNELSPQPINQEEAKKQNEFRRSFRILQKTTAEMIQKEPIIREAFFNGIFVDDELEHSDEEQTTGRRRLSLSSSSSGSLSSYFSAGSHGVSKEDFLVEEEGEIERLLAYLRCVELAKEASISSSSSAPAKSYRQRTTEFIRRRRTHIFPDTDGYEQLNAATVDIQGKDDESRSATVEYVAAVHRHRRELVIALHYDESSTSFSSVNERDQIKGILMNSLILQHKGDNSGMNSVGSDSTSFCLFDQAVKSLHKDILLRYLTKNDGNENDQTHFDFSSEYTLILCGHSLGAALACRIGDVFKHPGREKDSKSIPVRVYAFGPPPCLPTRQDGSEKENDYSYIVSIVNNHDCVPRWTESNLAGMKMSLRWTMDRKKRHFLQYHNQYKQARMHRDSMGTPKSIRRPTPRIPPCRLSSGDLNTFWKTSQGSNDGIIFQRDTKTDPKCIVPGKVVLMWNHSQDPTIIGAKVHVPEQRHLQPSNSYASMHRHHENRKNHDVLGRLWVEENMFSDHTIESYRSNLELLLGQVGNTI